jgi:hypothetical protein
MPTIPGKRSSRLTDADLQKFFRSRLAPLQPNAVQFASVNIDPNCASYFDEVFEPESIVLQGDIVTSLIGLWQRRGMRGLVALEPDIRRMAKELRAPDSQDQEISDLIYAMY